MTENSDELERIRQVYSTTYRPDPTDRAYTWHPRNPVSVYFRQARERALISLIDEADVALEKVQLLDIGCGHGDVLRFLMSLGARPESLYGLDLMFHRVKCAKLLSPQQMVLHVGNAALLPYADRSFDLVSQFTVFSSVFDGELRIRIADEMARLLRAGGYILWYDMRRADTETTSGIELAEIRQLFPSCTIVAIRRLHPPGASRIARRSLLLCDLWDRFAGRAKTHYLILLQRNA